jgi:hypothetical protein
MLESEFRHIGLIYDNSVQFFVPVQVIIATPGRILDLMDKNVAIMDSCRVLVLDEVNMQTYFGNVFILLFGYCNKCNLFASRNIFLCSDCRE